MQAAAQIVVLTKNYSQQFRWPKNINADPLFANFAATARANKSH